MNYPALTQAQSDQIAADNRAMLKLSRARHAEHLAQQIADAENCKRPAWVDLDAAKNMLAQQYAARTSDYLPKAADHHAQANQLIRRNSTQHARQFSVEPQSLTGWGWLL